jgi:OOP family OmpA-OmpF porin
MYGIGRKLMKFRTLGMMLGVALLAGACSDARLIDSVEGMQPKEKGFKANLQHQYLTLAKTELDEGDRFDAGVFARRAEAAAMGKDVNPDDLFDRSFSDKNRQMVHAERGRLMAALDGGGRTESPAIAARAQTQFDCWVQELEENDQPEDIEKCRKGYFDAMDALAEAMKKPAPVAAKPAPKPAPAPAAAPDKGPFVVYFEFNVAEVKGAEAGVTLVKAARAIEENKSKSVIVVGHTDTAGRDSYNQRLAMKRAENVRQALMELGVSADLIDPVSVGESDQEKQTADGVKEGANRRVVIKLY